MVNSLTMGKAGQMLKKCQPQQIKVTLGVGWLAFFQHLSRFTLGYSTQQFLLRFPGLVVKHLIQALPSVQTL